VLCEQTRNGTLAFLDGGVDVAELAAEALGDDRPHRALAGAHEADEDEMLV
jgi:hypothetical protein